MRKRQRRFLDEREVEEPLVNLTPLIDVVFVVLISFMLIAPLLNIDSVTLAPSSVTGKKDLTKMASPIAISILSDNSILFQGVKMSLAELEKHLVLEKTRKPNEIPQMIPDARCHFETYQKVKNILESCGFEQMDVLLKPS